MTVQTLDRCLPPAMPGVTFLSGGISEEDSSIYLNEINKLDRKYAGALTFSYSRALQARSIPGAACEALPRPTRAARRHKSRPSVLLR